MPATSELLVDIRARINYESFYRTLCPTLRRAGREMVARCPFHDDASPSLSINAETGLWMCRVPSCPGHAGGDFISFLRRVGLYGFQDAVRIAADHVGIDIGEARTTRAARLARENASIDEDELLARYQESIQDVDTPQTPLEQFIDEGIVEAAYENLRTLPHRITYLNEVRGLNDEMIDRWRIGHDGERYTIPIRDIGGRVVNIRRYNPNDTNGRKMISWRTGYGETRLFPLDAFADQGPIYIMEGEWDCLLAQQYGLNAITTTGGAGAWKEEWNSEFGGRDVVICYDNDDAGRAGALNVATSLSRSSEPSTIRILDWRHILDGPVAMPEGYDFTDYIIRDHCTVEAFKQNVSNLAFWTEVPPPEPPPSTPPPELPIDGPVNRTDVGNARRLARRHGGDVRYVSRSWYVWDGTRYALDETGEIDRRAKDTVRSIWTEAMSVGDDDLRGKLAAFSLASESASRIRAMVDLAKSEIPLAMSASAMDTNPHLLNCTNGTYDFQEHTLRAHRREDLITMSTRQPFDSANRCPAWEDFLLRTFDHNENVIEFVQRAVGYSLIGVTTEQVLFFCYGTGANGKSTFLETIRDVVGDYARNADFSTFATQRGGHSGPRNDIMRLRNARFVTAIEFDAGRALDEIVIKQLTGGDTISARRLYSEAEEFRPTFTPWIAGNHKPIVKGTDEAIWRRLRLIPFSVTIPPAERDPLLRRRLYSEAPGILRWAVAGAESWMTSGLRPPDEVLLATASYRAEMDTVEPFLEARTIRETGATVKASELYTTYKHWAEESGEDPISKTAFGLRLSEKGYESRNRGGTQYKIGLRLRRTDDLLDDAIAQNGTHPEPIHDSVHEDVVPFEPHPPRW